MPISVRQRTNLVSLFETDLFQSMPSASQVTAPRHQRYHQRTIPFCPIAKRVLFAVENLPNHKPFQIDITPQGFSQNLFCSHLNDEKVCAVLNAQTPRVENMADRLTVLMPHGLDFTDKSLADICSILRKVFVRDVILLNSVLSKTPHGGVSRNRIIRTLLRRYNLEDLYTPDAIVKACQRETERLGVVPFSIDNY